jgi:hypothetical protein
MKKLALVSFAFTAATIIYLFPEITHAQYYGDANGDRLVNGSDYIIWLNHYHIISPTPVGPADGDFDGNGQVNGADYIIWLNTYNTIIPTPSPQTTLTRRINVPYVAGSNVYDSSIGISGFPVIDNSCNTPNQIQFGANTKGEYPDLTTVTGNAGFILNDEAGYQFQISGANNQNHTISFSTLGRWDNIINQTVYTNHCAKRPLINRLADLVTTDVHKVIIQGLSVPSDGCSNNQVTFSASPDLSVVRIGDEYIDGAGTHFSITAIDNSAKRLTLNGTCSATYTPRASINRKNLSRTASYWFGQIKNTIPMATFLPYNSTYQNLGGTNYAEAKIGYDDSGLFITTSVVDRRAWYQTPSATAADFTTWDSLSLYFHPPTSSHLYRFDLELSYNLSETARASQGYQRAYVWNTSSHFWEPASLSITSKTNVSWHTVSMTQNCQTTLGYCNNAVNIPCDSTNSCYIGAANNNTDIRGYIIQATILWSSFGLSSPPHTQTWDYAVTVYDRDDQAGDPAYTIPPQSWPSSTISAADPTTWGQLHLLGETFKTYADSISDPLLPGKSYGQTYSQTISNPHTLKVYVEDNSSVGGVSPNLCSDGPEHWRYFTDWADRTHPDTDKLFIQNQSNLADWPCYSKTYLKFPVSSVSELTGKKIKSAKLSMWMLGNNGSFNDYKMLTHIFTINPQDWQTKASATWNNAPQALENITATWVAQKPAYATYKWKKEDGQIPLYQWDVSKAFADAKSQNQSSLYLGMYITGVEMHQGFHLAPRDHWTNQYGANYYTPYIEVEYGD